jgi:hypothetical protein
MTSPIEQAMQRFLEQLEEDQKRFKQLLHTARDTDPPVVCMHCKRWLRGPAPYANEQRNSHGLCLPCLEEHHPE